MRCWLAIVTLFVLSCAALLSLDPRPECESGSGCHRCDCQGDYDKDRAPGEPDNPRNKRWPRKSCQNWCSKSCCECKAS